MFLEFGQYVLIVDMFLGLFVISLDLFVMFYFSHIFECLSSFRDVLTIV